MHHGAVLSIRAGRIAIFVWCLGLSGLGQAAVMEWVGGAFGGGEWHVPGNWSSNPLLPGPLDNVVIGGDPGTWPRVVHSQGNDTVKTLSNQSSLKVTNSQLTVTGNVTFGERSELVVEGPGAFFRGQGSAFLIGPELGVIGGGEISLPGAKHFAGNGSPTSIWAAGAGGKIDLPALEDISGSPASMNARDGATIHVPKLTHIEERSGFYVDGIGSKIDLSSVRDLPPSEIDVRNGGEVVLPLEPFEYTEVRIEGAQSKVNLTHRQTLDNMRLRLFSGAHLEFSLVDQMASGVFETRGGNSLLNLSTVKSIDPPPFSGWSQPTFNAGEQSRIDLSGLERLTGAQPWFEAKGPGAVIDLSNLESFVGSGQLLVSGGAKILVPKLTRLEGSYVQVEGAGSHLQLDGLSTVDFFTLSVKSGAQMHFPLVTGLNTAPGSRGNSLSADGGVIDVANATVLRGAQAGHSRFEALNGGRVDLSGVGEVVVGNAIFLAEGVGAVVDLNRVARMRNAVNEMSVTAGKGGRVDLRSLVTADGIELVADGAGSSIDLSKLEQLANSSARVLNGATLALPATTLSSTRRLWAEGEASKLSLTHLRVHQGQENELFDFQATYGGRLELPSLETLSIAGSMRAEFERSVIDLPVLQSLAGQPLTPLQITLERGGQLHAPSMQSLAHAQIQVAQAGSWFETKELSTVENVSIAVLAAQGELGTAPTLTARTFLLQASQPDTSLKLPTLEALVGTEGQNATILASEGASIELPLLHSLQYSSVAARDPASRLAIGALATMDNGVVVAEGGNVRVEAVQIDARNGALGAQGGRLELPLLESFRDPTGASSLTAEAGVIDLGQQSVAFSGVTIRKYTDAELHAGRIELDSTSRLEGAGPLDADVANAGALSVYPGTALTIAGDYEQQASGALQAMLAGNYPASELAVEGVARLGGRLDLQFNANDPPLLGSQHTILRAERIEGAFASGGVLVNESTMLTPLIGEQMVVVVAALGGDANLDGQVDLNDFGALKRGFGTGHGVGNGDFDGDGAVTLSDFGVLKKNFGRQGPSFDSPSTPAPEPSTALLLVLGVFAVFRQRPRPRR